MNDHYEIHVPAEDVDKYRIYAMQLKISSQELALQAAHKGIRRLKERQKKLVEYFNEAEKYKTLAATYKRKLDVIDEATTVDLETMLQLSNRIKTQSIAIQDLKRKLGDNTTTDGASGT